MNQVMMNQAMKFVILDSLFIFIEPKKNGRKGQKYECSLNANSLEMLDKLSQ